MSVFAEFMNKTHANRVPNSDYIRTENEPAKDGEPHEQPAKEAQPVTK